VIGKTVSHYRILEKLGEGGMGVVYKARDERLHRDVALKVLPRGLLDDEDTRRRFRQEAIALAKLNHPNVEAVYQFDSDEGMDFLVTEFVPGTTLAEQIENAPLSTQSIAQYSLQIVSALEEAHDHGVVHCDLKPANIMVGPKGQVKILDFGIARILRVDEAETTLTAIPSDNVAGTLPYMAPEQLDGGQVDGRTDIYAAGVVLYKMCVGRLPFEEKSAPALICQILRAPPPPPRRARPDLPASLERVILRCLEKQPERRYQSARDLRNALAGIPAVSPKAGRASRFLAKARWWAAALVVTAAAVIIWRALESRALAFANRDWLVIAQFENQTGEPVFDHSLDAALRVSMEQSSYVNVIPRQRMKDALQRMKQGETARITETLGLEIAEREGAKALLSPSITGVGGNYLLSATLRVPGSGASVQSNSVRAGGRDEVLPALDKLARRIRQDLGESVNQISRQAKPLAKVTTSSLEALKQYSLGIERQYATDFEEAKGYHESALAIDPGFVSAMASLGMLNFERFDKEKGKALLAQAVQRVNSLTDRERYGILAFYANAIERDMPKAIDLTKARLALYPDDSAALNNLGWYSNLAGRYKESEDAYKNALRVEPRMTIAAMGLAGVYLYKTGRLDDAVELMKRQIALGPATGYAYDNLGYAHLGKGEYKEALGDFEKAVAMGPPRAFILYRLAHTHRLLGDYRGAVEVLQRIPAADPSESIAYDLAVNYRLMNEPGKAKRAFEEALRRAEKDTRANPKSLEYRLVEAAVRARLGQPVDSRLAQGRRTPPDPEECFLFANLYAVQGKPEQAVDELETAIANGYRNYPWIRIHPDHASLAGHPRFAALMKRIQQ
jgi:tetratricopeptide (TPR) repeat protein/tRNA A-37 threonylcarbamoyl transferase component Bud32